MFNVYYANQLITHKDILLKHLKNDPIADPFAQEIVLVQSLGMAQWLQMQIANELGVSAHIEFPYPTRFLWQQYRTLFPELPKENLFERQTMVWRLMRLIPRYLSDDAFQPLAFYLTSPDQLKYYQLALKIADLFDQYLVYRPHWLIHWEKQENDQILNEIKRSLKFNSAYLQEIEQTILWQGILWNALVADIRENSDEVIFNTSHRAYLQQRYFDKLETLSEQEKANLPKRIFVFGISALPHTQLAVLKKLSEHCHIHLFFTNPSEAYWGDQTEDKMIEKLALNQAISAEELETLFENQGNPLLSTWGKQGKEFLNLLIEQDPDRSVSFFEPYTDKDHLLNRIKNSILTFTHHTELSLLPDDHSLQIHSCHSKMREVEVLHNRLLAIFDTDPELSPKDIIVMSPDIDSYAPYIHAVFSRYGYGDPRHIPFTLSDQKISYIDPIIAGFLNLLSQKEKRFSAEEILDLLNIQAVQEKYQLDTESLSQLREWIKNVGIRAGLAQDNPEWQNYNSWENGLNRLLLGTSLKEENHAWQGVVAFDESYGLSAELVGSLAKFIENLTAWSHFLADSHTAAEWQTALLKLIEQFYAENSESADSLLTLQQAVEDVIAQMEQAEFTDPIGIDIIQTLFAEQLSQQRSNLHFLVGKVNFCTLLPMRAIPFKVVCLLGMNEGEFPRQQIANSFDLMQYSHQKGDRAKRDDDRYLFLEALLSAQKTFYISYIGQSLISDKEKLPSILVSQLIDYIKENLSEQPDLPVKKQLEQLIIKHPMTVFSPINFTDKQISYDKEWLQAKLSRVDVSPFLTPFSPYNQSLPDTITIADLVAYLQNPAKFYFNHQLGVKFEQYDDQLEESEIFTLSNLAVYQFKSDLVKITAETESHYFEHAKLKGELPACHFGELAAEQLSAQANVLREALGNYLNQDAALFEIDQQLEVNGKKVRLIGYIPNYFHDHIALWRVGKLRDKDLIELWLYTLLLRTQTEKAIPLTFYYLDSEVKQLSFKTIEQPQATEQLARYVQDYLASFIDLKLALTEQVKEYLTHLEESSPELIAEKLANSDNGYLQRIFSQQPTLDCNDIHQRTVEWFKLMIESQEIK